MPLFKLPVENNKHPKFVCKAEEEVWIVLFYEVAPFEDNVSTILSPIADISNLSISMQLRNSFKRPMNLSVHSSNALMMSFVQFLNKE